MVCTPLPGGGMICSRRQPRIRCSVPGCGNWATLLCDYPVKRKKSGTCDARLCERCAKHVDPDLDFCPPHAKQKQLEF